MDGQYVALLEMHCLLRQRLLDVQHNWRAIYSSVFCPLGKTAGIGHTPISLTILVAPSLLQPPCFSLFSVFAQEHYSRLQPALSSLLSHCSGLMQAVASGGPRGPRLLELARHLELTEMVNRELGGKGRREHGHGGRKGGNS